MANVIFTQIVRRLKWRFIYRIPLLIQLQRRLNYFFSNVDLLTQSITHKSVHSDPQRNYEQLEFLGDSVIDYLISDLLISEFPESSEGFLTRKRSELVQKKFLTRMGNLLGLVESISAMPSLDLSQEKVSQKQYANLFEAIIGAMYLDGGIKPCCRLIERTVWHHRQEAWGNINFKGLFIEYCQAQQLGMPRFIVIKTTGPEHQKIFKVTVRIGDREFPPGKGGTKKAAEQQAAQKAMDSIRPE